MVEDSVSIWLSLQSNHLQHNHQQQQRYHVAHFVAYLLVVVAVVVVLLVCLLCSVFLYRLLSYDDAHDVHDDVRIAI